MSHLIALIPARSGSKRIKNKNIKKLAGHPLIAYTISVALQSGIFSKVVVSTDNQKIGDVAKYYGAEVPFLRPKKLATDSSPDIYWLKFTLKKLNIEKNNYFSILRPTSPFRTKKMILKAWEMLTKDKSADSIRAVERSSYHPAKMWFLKGNRMRPVIKNPDLNDIEWFSTPVQNLPKIYVQNSSLEIARTEIPLNSNSIAGESIIPFKTEGYEGYDLNTEKDWIYAEYLIENSKVNLSEINKVPYKL